MVVRSVADIIECFDAGRVRILPMLRKTAPLLRAAVHGATHDLGGMAAGTPAPNYYAGTPLTFTPMGRVADRGWDHGPDVGGDGQTKYLKRIAWAMSSGGWRGGGVLHDILGFVPFCDTSTVDVEQEVATPTPSPRLRGGEGVSVYAVLQFANGGLSAVQTLSIRYLDANGVERASTPVRMWFDSATAWPVGFMAYFQSGVSSAGLGGKLPTPGGVQQILGVTFAGAPDVALVALVMVRDIAWLPPMVGRDPGTSAEWALSQAWVERDFARELPGLPIIDDDAYLAMAMQQLGGTTSQTIYATAEVIWR